MEGRQNVTFSLPESLLNEFRTYAAARKQSMTALAAEAIRRYMQDEELRREAARESIAIMRKGYDLGTNGQITWTRDELHER